MHIHKKMETTKKLPRRRSSIYVSRAKGPCNNKAGNFSTRFSLKAFVHRVKELTQTQKNSIIRTGFGNLLLIGYHMNSKNLLDELMKRWHQQKQAFVLAKGEIIRITPLDVALILGLRVTGQPVNVVRELDLPFLELEREYGAALWKRNITVGSIRNRLEALGESDDEDFVRSFLLFTFGTILFPNSSGNVDSRYLYLLRDLDSIGKFAWGLAVLDDLIYWLGKRKQDNVEYVGGCLILLQIWSYEHIDIARPSFLNHPIKFPRACRWDNSKSHKRNWFLLQFRNLQSNQISWNLDLTSEELEIDIVKELLISQREMVITDIDDDSQEDGTLANEDCSNQSNTSPDIASTSMGNQLSSQCQSDSPQDKHNNVDVSNNLGDGVLSNNDRSNLLPEIWDLASTSSGDQCPSPSPSYCPQLMQKHNIIDVSSDDNGDESTSEDCVMKREISKLRTENNDLKEELKEKEEKLSEATRIEEENTKLRKEVETLKHQNLLHLAAFDIVTRLKGVVFSKFADEVLGTNK